MAYSATIPPFEDRNEDQGIILPNTVLLNSTGNNLPIVHSKEIKGGLHYVEYLEYLNENSYRGVSIARREVGTTIAYISRHWDGGNDAAYDKYFRLIAMDANGTNPVWQEWKSTVNITPSGRPAFVRKDITERDALLEDVTIEPPVGPGDIAIIMDASGDPAAIPPLEGGATYILDEENVWQRFLFPANPNDSLAHTRNNDTQLIAELQSGNVVLTGAQIKNFMDAYSALQDGKSAYQIALDSGFVGSEAEWLLSLKGLDGKDGEPGEKGEQGIPGTNIITEGAPGLTVSDVAPTVEDGEEEYSWLHTISADEAILYKKIDNVWTEQYRFGSNIHRNELGGLILTTYDDVVAKIADNDGAGSLIVGMSYSFEYENKYYMPGVPVRFIYTHPTVEHLVLKAVSPNKLAAEGFSLEWPKDIVGYNINDILCEDNLTARKGFITYRRDTLLNNSTEGYCFRSTVFPRFPLVANEFDPGFVYNYGSVVKSTVNDQIYFYRHIKRLAGTTVTNSDYWAANCRISDNTLWPYYGSDPAFNRPFYTYAYMNYGGPGNPNGPGDWAFSLASVDTTQPKYFLTFTANRADTTDPNFGYHNWKGKNCHIRNSKGVLMNTVLIATQIGAGKINDATNFRNISIAPGCDNCTSWTTQQVDLVMGGNCGNNYFYGGNHANNLFGSNNYNNFCGDYFTRNNLFGNNIGGNTFTRLFADNTVMGYFENCTFAGFTQGNVFGQFSGGLSWGHNNFGNVIYTNRIVSGYQYGNRMYAGNGFGGNAVFDGMRDVVIGTDFNFNIVNKRLEFCEIGNGTQDNVFNAKVVSSGTIALPIVIKNSVINQKWTNVQRLNDTIVVERNVFNAVLTNYVFDENVIEKVLPEVDGGSGTVRKDFYFPEVSLDPVATLSFDYNIAISGITKSSNIASYEFYITLDRADWGTVKTTIGELNDWIDDQTNGTRYHIKCAQTKVAGAVDEGFVTLTFEEL